MPKIHKVLVEFVRSTSHLVEAFRFEIPLLKLRHPGDTMEIRSIPHLKDDHIATFDARSAYMFLMDRYGPLVGQVYTDISQFAADFNASASREAISDVTKIVKETNAAEVRQRSLERLERINGIGVALAPAFYAAGFDTIESVAVSSLNDLEVLPGVGAATAERIKTHAMELVQGLMEPSTSPLSSDPFSDPVTSDPFAHSA